MQISLKIFFPFLIIITNYKGTLNSHDKKKRNERKHKLNAQNFPLERHVCLEVRK